MKDETARPDLTGVPARQQVSRPEFEKSAKNKSGPMILPDSLGDKYLQLGNSLYRSARDRPSFSMSSKTIRVAKEGPLRDALKIAQANDWSAITVKGSKGFRREAYMIAAKQGMDVRGYRPSKLEKLEIERTVRNLQQRAVKQGNDSKAGSCPEKYENAQKAKRFMSNSHEENRRDPKLQSAQSLVAAAVIVARNRYPANPEKRKDFVAETKKQIATSLAAGKNIQSLQSKSAARETVQERIRQNTLNKDKSKGRLR